jgi:hypothetical protein
MYVTFLPSFFFLLETYYNPLSPHHLHTEHVSGLFLFREAIVALSFS